VSAPHPPIPPALWDRIKAFLAERRTGQISLNISQGSVRNLEIRERVSAGSDE
jgi:hypothetical protein